MTVKAKLYLIYFAFLGSVLGLVALWSGENSWRIQFGQQEIVGLKSLRRTFEVSKANHRYWLGEKPTRLDQRKIVENLDCLQEECRAYQHGPELATLISQLKASAMAQRWGRDFETGLNRVVSTIGDQSNLILDPDLDSYYLMDIGMLRLPQVDNRLAGIRRKLAKIEEDRGFWRQDSSARLMEQAEGVSNSLRVVRKELRLQNRWKALEAAGSTFTYEVTQLSNLLLAGAEDKSISEAVIRLETAQNKFEDLTLQTLQDVLQERVDSLEQQRFRTFALLAAVLAPLSILFLSIVTHTSNKVRMVSDQLAHITEGDLVRLDHAISSLAQGNIVGDEAQFTRSVERKGGNELKLVSASISAMMQRLRSIFESLEMTRKLLFEARIELAESERRFRTVADTLGEGLVTVDMEGKVQYCNQAFSRMLGRETHELIGVDVYSLVEQHDESESVVSLRLAHQQGVEHKFEGSFVNPTGAQIWVMVTVAALRDEDGKLVGGALTFADISERKLFETQLTHQAYHDTLTGLPNRALFSDRLERAIARHKRSKAGYAVMFLDLDNFKVINDSLGHEAGDKLLVTVASRIQACIRDTDTLSRLGGDEFTVILEDLRNDEVRIVAERILDSLSQPINVGPTHFTTGVSIGIAYGDDSMDSNILLKNADTAMYEAKGSGKQRYVIYDDSMSTKAEERLRLEQDLRKAIQSDELTVVYQPIVDLKTNLIAEVETLCRWRHPDLGPISPDKFIPIAEESSLIFELGYSVMRKACAEAVLWPPQAGGEPPVVAVNITQSQIHQEDFIDQVKRVLSESGLPPERLKLEVTESAMMQNADYVVMILNQLRNLGVRLAIDDFGTGYSSMAMLRDLPVDAIKIDRSFVSRVAVGSSEDDSIVRAVLNLSESLNLYVVSEGVETEAQLEFLIKEGCRYAQGYYFARPLFSEDLMRLLYKEVPFERAA